MAQFNVSPAQRERWEGEKIIQLHEHPGFFANIARVPEGAEGTVRETEHLDDTTNAVAGLIREATDQKFCLYLGAPLPMLFSARVFQEALFGYLNRGAHTGAWIICGEEATELKGSKRASEVEQSFMDFYDPLRELWYPVTQSSGYRPRMERFLVTDTHAWWVNGCGEVITDLMSAYAFRSPARSKKLWDRFNLYFNAFRP